MAKRTIVNIRHIISDNTASGTLLDEKKFKQYKRFYAEYKIKVLDDFCIHDDAEHTIWNRLMSATSFIHMDRIARKIIDERFPE